MRETWRFHRKPPPKRPSLLGWPFATQFERGKLAPRLVHTPMARQYKAKQKFARGLVCALIRQIR
jgi:hypothetical protein